jgi:hypothetical protein
VVLTAVILRNGQEVDPEQKLSYEWYIDDIKSTIEFISDTLKNTNFDTETIVYCSSW